LVCSTCGKSNKSTMKYCGVCGTALEIIWHPIVYMLIFVILWKLHNKEAIILKRG
jgi:hypothetical protein